MFHKQFSVKIPFNMDCVEGLSAIMGKTFDKKTKSFSFPSIEIFEVADIVDEYFPEVTNRLRYAEEYKEHREIAKEAVHMVYLSRAKSVRFKPKHPEDCKPYPFQAAGVYYSLYEGRDHVLIADSMGLGKSCTSIMIANEIGARKGIFICPNSAKINWQREIQKWSTETDNVGYITAQSTRREIERYDYISINYDILEKFKDILLGIKWDIAVCDEAHKIKNAKAKRTQVATEICDSAEYRALLSGSPILNRPAELWNLVHTLNPVYWMNWFDFVGRYCDAKRDPYTGKFDYSGSSHSEELQDKLRMTVMIRRLKKDVLKNLPPKTRQIVEIPATKKFTTLLAAQEKYVGKIRKAMDIALNTEIKGDPEAQEHKFREAIRRSGLMNPKEFEEIQSLRKATALAKAPEVADFADLLLDAKPKIGIYAHHIEVQQYFIKHFEKRCVYITGGMSTIARQRAVDAFQNNPRITVFVGSIMAAAEAITLTAADTCLMAEMFWTPGINMQVEDRFHRIGTVNNVLIYYAMLQHSIDYYVANMVVSKMEMIEKSLDTKTSKITRKRRFR